MDPETNPVPPIEPKQAPSKNAHVKWLSLGGIILILLVALAASIYLKSKVYITPQPNMNVTHEPNNTTPPPTNQNPPSTFELLPNPPAQGPAVDKATSGLITWHYPTKSHFNVIKHTPTTDGIPDLYDQTNGYSEFLEVGKFNSGQYQGQYLFVVYLAGQGPGFSVMHVVADTNVPDKQTKLTILTNYSDPVDNLDPGTIDATKFTKDAITKIPDLENAADFDRSGP